MNELISIIIPAYNVEKYLHKSLTSVVNQTYAHLEIIVVNDGSTDNTGKILDDFAKKDSRIIVIHQKNQGVSSARNSALAIAKGDYVGFVDADDEVLPKMYEILHNEIRNNNADIAHCGFELVTPKNTKIFYGTEKYLIQNNNEAIKSLLKGYPFEPSSCTKLYSKSVVKNIFFDREIKINEDLLYNLEAFLNSKKIVFYDKILYRYMHNPASASRSGMHIGKLMDMVSVAEKIQEKLFDTQLKKEVNIFYNGKLTVVLQSLYQNRMKNAFVNEVKKKLGYSSNLGLSFRLLVLKYSLLYFPKGYFIMHFFYNLFTGTNKKWSNH